MYSDRIRKYLIIALALGWGVVLLSNYRPKNVFPKPKAETFSRIEPLRPIDEALDLVRNWRNKDALFVLDNILTAEPNNLDAIWGRAEIFRRAEQNKLAELMFKEILNARPGYAPALISLAFIRYKEGNLTEALNLANQIFIVSANNRRSQALAYIILGLINEAAPSNGGILSRINRGIAIKNNFLKARELAPELPETHFCLGTYYLNAPMLEGGNLNQAIKELDCTVKISPEFTEANARLAQAYKKKCSK